MLRSLLTLAIVSSLTLTASARDFQVKRSNFSAADSGRLAKRDNVSPKSSYFESLGKGGSAVGTCKVSYDDAYKGACVSDKNKCGAKVFAYVGDWEGPHKTTVTVVFVKNNDEIQRIHQYHRDTCDWLSKDEIWFTVSAFEELGGVKDKVPEANSYIPNVNWKYV